MRNNVIYENVSVINIINNNNLSVITHSEENGITFAPLCEATLFERIDFSLSQADNGEYTDADVFGRELSLEFDME